MARNTILATWTVIAFLSSLFWRIGIVSAEESREISLADILAFAAKHAPVLRVAQAKVNRSDVDITNSSFLLPSEPTLQFGIGVRFQGNAQGVDVQAELQQPIEIAGERGLRKNVAQKHRRMTQFQRDETHWSVHRKVHAAYHHALVARERAKIQNKVLAFTKRLLDIARRRLIAQDISQLQVRIAEGELSQAEQTTLSAESSYRAAQLTLAEASGWPNIDAPPAPTGSLDQPWQTPPVQKLLTLAYQHNPELRAHEAAQYASVAQLQLAKREAWPKPTLGIRYARESEPGSGGNSAHLATVTVGIPLPLWRQNARTQRSAAAEVAIIDAERKAFLQNFPVHIARAATAVNSGAKRIEAYSSHILPAFEHNLALLQRAFELGEIDLLQVMTAHARFLESERDALAAYETYFEAAADLEAIVGTEIWPKEQHHHNDDNKDAP